MCYQEILRSRKAGNDDSYYYYYYYYYHYYYYYYYYYSHLPVACNKSFVDDMVKVVVSINNRQSISLSYTRLFLRVFRSCDIDNNKINNKNDNDNTTYKIYCKVPQISPGFSVFLSTFLAGLSASYHGFISERTYLQAISFVEHLNLGCIYIIYIM